MSDFMERAREALPDPRVGRARDTLSVAGTVVAKGVEYPSVLALKALANLLAAYDELAQDLRETDHALDRSSEILRRIVLQLRGAPPPLTSWSWHDIPELVAELQAERDELVASVREAMAAAWDAGLAAGQHNEHEFRPGRKITNPHRKGKDDE